MLTLFLYALLAIVVFIIIGALLDYAIRTFVTMTPEFAKLYNFVVKVVIAIAALIFVVYIVVRILLPLLSGHRP